MKTKRVVNGKEYFYDLKAVWLSETVHSKLKEYSTKHKISLTKAVNKLLNENEKR